MDLANEIESPIRICFLIDNLVVAGTEKHLLDLIRDLDRKKFDPLLVLLDGENKTSRKLEPVSCRVIRLGLQSWRGPTILATARKFVRLLRDFDVQILQMYFPDSTFFGAICGRWAGVPVLIRTRRNAGYWMTRPIDCVVVS